MRDLNTMIKEMEVLSESEVSTPEEFKEISRLLDDLTEEIIALTLTSKSYSDKMNKYSLKEIAKRMTEDF